jgi:hypothetical protein
VKEIGSEWKEKKDICKKRFVKRREKGGRH